MANPPVGPPASLEALPSPAPPTKDEDLPAFRYAQALAEAAKANSEPYTRKFRRYWDFLLGKGHWLKPMTQAARMLDGWAFRGVVNDLWAVHSTKRATITQAPSKTFSEPLDDQSSYMDRLMVSTAIDHEMERLRFGQVKGDIYDWGSAVGIGIAMLTAKPDSLTGDMSLNLRAINPDDFSWDPSADSLKDCRYIRWGPLLDMSVVRQMWPTKAPFVVPTLTNAVSEPGGVTYKTTGSDENLIYGTTGEFVVDSQSMLKARKARVEFIWIKDPESLIEELRQTVLQDATQGLQCQSCDQVYEPGAIPQGMDSSSPCPLCAGDLQDVTIPQKVKTDKVIHKAYPYGRLIVFSGKTLLYDGENPYELEHVFPFYVYHHYRVPGVFPGFGDVALLRSLQEETDTTIGQCIDYVRLGVNGPFIYPMGFKSFTKLGNGPAERHPGPDHAPWLPRFVTPEGFNVQAWSSLLGALDKHFLVVSGIGELSGEPSSPPISATETEITSQRISQRMKGHVQEWGQFCSDLADGVLQMGRQFYGALKCPQCGESQSGNSGMSPGDPCPDCGAPLQSKAQMVPVTLPNSEVSIEKMEWASLPNVKVRVHIGLEEASKDKLLGQNSVPIFTNPAVMNSPYLDVILGGIGYSDSEIKEVMQRRALEKERNGPPQPPPPNPAKMLSAMSDVAKTLPTYFTFDQFQEAVAKGGITPSHVPEHPHVATTPQPAPTGEHPLTPFVPPQPTAAGGD